MAKLNRIEYYEIMDFKSGNVAFDNLMRNGVKCGELEFLPLSKVRSFVNKCIDNGRSYDRLTAFLNDTQNHEERMVHMWFRRIEK